MACHLCLSRETVKFVAALQARTAQNRSLSACITTHQEMLWEGIQSTRAGRGAETPPPPPFYASFTESLVGRGGDEGTSVASWCVKRCLSAQKQKHDGPEARAVRATWLKDPPQALSTPKTISSAGCLHLCLSVALRALRVFCRFPRPALCFPVSTMAAAAGATEQECINTVRVLSCDMVSTANSGHPGA